MDAATPCATYTAARIGNVHVDSPDGHMAEVAFRQGVPIVTSKTADPTTWVIAKIRSDRDK